MERTKYKYLYWIFAILFVVAAVIAGWQYRRVNAMKISVENNYNRAFHELVDYIDNVETLLQKSMLASSSAQMATISSELFRECAAAKACLAQLPISEINLEKTEKFLSQIGDYTYMLSQRAIYDEEISEEDYKNLASLGDYATNLNNELLKMQVEIYDGTISFGKMQKEADLHLSSVANADEGGAASGFERVEKQFQEYPSLIYDGPFSEHIERITPIMCQDKEKISEQQALNVAKSFLGGWGEIIQSDGESQNTALESYLFKGSSDTQSIYAAFTKKGGYPLYFLINREIGEENITVENAILRARNYLYEKGYTSMQNSYYDKANGIATINFAYKQGEVVCYSDLIKVKVALDDGEIIGFEANGYIMNHKQRVFPETKISESEVREKINSHLTIDKISLALIPKDSKKEVFCYEVKGKYKERNFLVYINAENGREEKILMLIESENGILTV